jgi:hypothetical protein
VIFVAQVSAVFADPFHHALLAAVEVCYTTFLPVVGEAESIYLEDYALDFQLFTAESAELLV